MSMPPAPLHDDVIDDESRGEIFPPDLHDVHHLRLKAFLLLVLVVVSFGTCFFARDLQALMPNWPLAYWMAAQGAVVAFLIITVVYCVAMDYFERKEQGGSSGSALAADAAAADAAQRKPDA